MSIAKAPQAMYYNDYGLRNINSQGLNNAGDHSNLMVGQMAMHNVHGTSNIGLGAVQAGGMNTNTAIGLQNLEQYDELMNFAQVPVFDNTGGIRNINVKLLDNEGAKSISRVGEMRMKNGKGQANIKIAKAIAGGKGTETDVGLLNLEDLDLQYLAAQQPKQAAPIFSNVGGQRNILLKELLAKGDGSKTNIGEMAMNNSKGKANIQLGNTANAGKGALVNIGLLNMEDVDLQYLAEQQQKQQKPKQAAPLFVNAGGQRNILLKELLAKGANSKTNIGEMAMNNAKGTANITLGKTANMGQGSIVNIGLQNLEDLDLQYLEDVDLQFLEDVDLQYLADKKAQTPAPMFSNVGGERNILLKQLLAQGAGSKTNIGEMAMDNSKGKANINLGKTANAGKGALVNIGLQNLEDLELQYLPAQQKPAPKPKQPAPMFINDGGFRNIQLADMLNKGQGSVFKVGEMAMSNKKGQASINVGKSMNTGAGSLSEIGLMLI